MRVLENFHIDKKMCEMLAKRKNWYLLPVLADSSRKFYEMRRMHITGNRRYWAKLACDNNIYYLHSYRWTRVPEVVGQVWYSWLLDCAFRDPLCCAMWRLIYWLINLLICQLGDWWFWNREFSHESFEEIYGQ